jgi:hypothetical protein
MRVGGRLRRAARRLQGRLAPRPGVPVPAAVLAGGALLPAYLREGRPDAARLREAFRPLHDERALSGVAAAPTADCGLSGLAAGILAGRLPYFDRRLEAALPLDWLQVPGGRRWPLLPAEAYEARDFLAHGDVRGLWELGRLQALPLLAAAARLALAASPQDRSAARYSEAALGQLADFRGANPLGWGPHWIAGLESGLRIFSLLWTWQLLPPAALSDPATLLLAAALRENGRFTAAHLSEKAVANNHLLGEAAALYCLGAALPVFRESAEWGARGRSILIRELPLQLLADGVLAEQAVEYHRFVLDFLLQCLLWGRAAGDPAAEDWLPPLAAMMRPLAALTGPDGLLVPLGDDDAGRILRLDDGPRRDARGLLALAGRLLGTEALGAEVAALARALPLAGEALWLAGPALTAGPSAGRVRPAAAAPGDAAPAVSLCRFPAAGWHVARWGGPAGPAGLPGGQLAIKAGPMGRGGAGHSHADALSLCLAFGGRPLLVEAGTYLYNGPQRWRDHFRGAGAHNLLRVGGRDPAEPLPAPDRFGWARRCAASLAESPTPWAGALLDWTARREGDRDPQGRPVDVNRRFALLAPDLLLILDSWSAAAPLALELLWQGAPELAPLADPGPAAHCDWPGLSVQRLALGEGGQARLWLQAFLPAGLDSALRIGDEEAPAGWVSPAYGERLPAPQWRLAGQGPATGFCLSLLADPAGGLRASRLGVSAAGGLQLEIQHQESEIRTIALGALASPAAI